jgi:hypothetical protein
MTHNEHEQSPDSPRDRVLEDAFGVLVRHVRAPLGFHAKVMAQIDAARPTLRDRLVRSLSELWQPTGAGALRLVTALDTEPQENVFQLDEGDIRVTCHWWIPQQDQPGMLHVTWQAHVALPVEFWIRFTRPADPSSVLGEVRLGSFSEGDQGFTAEMLGFDPAREPWACAILLRESHR